jgi:hypothetical protein
MNTTDQTIAKIHNALRLVKETEALLRETLAEVSKEPTIHFYEVFFGNRKDYNEGEQPSMCIRGIRKPTLEEANDYYKVDCSFFGGEITEIEEINEAEANKFFGMDEKEGNGIPVFGKDPPRPIHPTRNCYFVYRGSYLNPKSKMFRVWARNPEEALSAFKETWEANRDFLYEHHAFMAAVHGALEPFPLPRD